MSTTSYDRVLSLIEDLSPEEQLSLMEQLTVLLRKHVVHQAKHDIMELQGLGKEIWHGIDAQQYVDQERASWHG